MNYDIHLRSKDIDWPNISWSEQESQDIWIPSTRGYLTEIRTARVGGS